MRVAGRGTLDAGSHAFMRVAGRWTLDAGRLIIVPVLLSLASHPTYAQRPAPSAPAELDRALRIPSTDLIRAHLRFLSHDLLEGRAPGTRGGRLAAHYIAAQMEAAGIGPGGNEGSYFQRVSLAGVTPDPSIIVGIGRRTIELSYGEDYVAWPSGPDSALTVDAEIVFVGYGIQAPEWQWDDYKDEPMVGKILLMLVNDPGLTDASRFHGRAMTYYGRWTYKLEQAARLGAVGVILIHADESATYGWGAMRNSWTGEQVMSTDAPAQMLRFGAWITEDGARQLADAAGKDFDAMRHRAQQRTFRPIALGAHAVVHIKSRVRRLETRNVIGRLDGADSLGCREAVILTAHYDHLGIGRPIDGDSIYNGAEDNASGVATMLAVAQAFGRSGLQPRRSVVFIATTAQEPGLLGAETYVRDPAVPLERTVAVINLDRANLRGAARDAVALGAERSELKAYVERAAADEGLTVSPDPNPHAGHFFRSDHFPFARAGVAVLSLRIPSQFADRPEGWAAQQERRYVSQRYHQPGDEFSAEFEYAGALQQARLIIRLGAALASTSDFPQWLPDTEFRLASERLRLRRQGRR